MVTQQQHVANQFRHVILGPGAGRNIPLGAAGVVTVKAGKQDTGGTLSVYEFDMPARTAGPPLHLHRGWDEMFYVLDGEMTFLIDGSTSTVPTGGFVFIPRGVLHTFWNEGANPARQLTVFTPGGIEDYFDAVTSAMVDGENILDTALTLMEEHDMIVPPNSRPAYGALPADDSIYG